MDILTRSGSLRASINPSDSSKCIRSVMQAGRLELHFSSSKPIPFALGDYADFEGDRYTLCYPSEVSKVQREWLEYSLVLHSSAEELKQRLVKSPEGETKVDFVMVGSPTDHLRLITRAMGEGWSVGTSLEAGDRLVAYKSDTCYAALCRLAEEYKTEWVVRGKTISLRREELWRDDPVAMSYGRGMGFLSGVSRSGDGDKLPISRLYVLGGSRNIDPAAYGSRSLHLPDGSTALSSGVEGREAALDLSHIYPSRVGTVSEVVTVSEEKCFYDIKDDSIPAELNYSDCRIPGEKAVIRFQSGALAGRELEIRQSETALEGYHHEERRFELVPRQEDGFTFPSARWMPKAGDKYAVFGIALPPSYIKEAEERMLREAKRYLSDNMEPVYTFRGEVDGIWARKHWLEVGGKLVPGGHVLFSDPEFHPSGSVIRIVSTTQAVNDPHAPSITLSTAPVPGSFMSRIERVEADEVVRREQVREVQRQQSQSYRQALEHLSMVDRAVEGLEGFARRIKPSVIETMGILVGSQATQLDFVRAVGSLESVTPAINFDPSTKALHIGESVLRHQTIGITTVKDRRDPSEYRYWRLPEYVSPPLTDPDRRYYIYARAARVGTEGAFLLSEEPIPMESDPDYFHLLIGTLSSIDGGDRAYNRLYGFSMISPGQMVVDTISSANGRMSIDLARGEIYASSVSFSRPDGARGSLSDLAGEVDELQSHPPKIVEGKWHVWDGKAQTYVNTGDDARGETGKNGLSPKIVNGKWSVYDGSRWVSTGVPAQGPKGEQGAPGKDVDPKVLNDLKTAVDDARRKLDDTVTKAELDGVVSAQEQKDIQAAKAALDAAKKAYDDAVKRAKELDSEIQVGGRNLLLNTSKERRRKGSYTTYKFSEPVTEPGMYILSFHCEVIRPPLGSGYLVIFGYQTTLQLQTVIPYIKGATHYEVPIDVKRITHEGWASEAKDIYIYPNPGYENPAKTPDCGEFILRNVKLERGTVATDWTPAPEDVQVAMEEVAQAKAELAETKSKAYADGKITATEQLAIDKAQAAYDNAIRKAKELDDDFQARMDSHMQQIGQYVAMAQQEAGAARQQTEVLHQYVDGAYKDGIITEVESKAIATYINEVEAMWSSAFGSYERVYSNALLTGTTKTALADAKITLAGAKDNLIGQIKRAISDGKATKAEATETERLYNVYKSALRDFQRALKTAEDAIRDATVAEVGSGSLNYLPADVIRSDKNRSLTSLRLAAGFFRAVPVGVEVPINIGYDVYFDNDRTDNKVKTTFFYTDEKDNYSQGSRRYIHYSITTGLKGRAWHHIWKSGKVARLDKHVRIMGWLADTVDTGTYPSEVRNVYLRVGSRDLGWTPAPEDVQAEIDAERTARETAVREVATGLSSATTLIESLQRAQDLKLDRDEMPEIGYLLAALKKPKGTTVAGGLLLSNQIILSDAEDDIISATLSGQRAKGAKSLRLGIDYTDGRDAGTEQTALCNDGTGHLGELYFGGREISFGSDPTKRYMQIGGTARSEYDMVNASTVIRKFGISGGTVRKSGTFVLDRFDSRYSNREIKYTANLSAWAEARAYRVSDNGGWDPNDHRYYKPEYEEFVRTESSATVQLRLELTRGGSTIKTVTSPQVSVSVSAQGGQFGINEEIPQSALYAEDRKSQDVTITISPSDVREQDTVTLSLVTTVRRSCYHHQGNNEIDRYASATASAGSIINFLPYDTSQPMVSVTKDRAAFFYGRSKYILLNYLESYVMKVVGNMLLQGNLTLKGDLTAEYADFPGVPMIGGMVSEDCIFKKSFGRYKNRDGKNVPQVSYDYSSKIYTVYHSIGNDKYIPVVTPMDHRWGDTLSISNVLSYSFQVQLTNGNQDRNQCAFTYVCFKAD